LVPRSFSSGRRRRAHSSPPEAAAFLISWDTAGGGFTQADPVFWGAFFALKLTRVDFGATAIQALGKWTLSLDLIIL
jgi:hypothetical protein